MAFSGLNSAPHCRATNLGGNRIACHFDVGKIFTNIEKSIAFFVVQSALSAILQRFAFATSISNTR
jgi:hypothetical protein